MSPLTPPALSRPHEKLLLVEQILKVGYNAPDKLALHDDQARVSYAQLSEAVDRVGAALLVQGLEPGARVAIAMQPSAAYAAVVMACMAVGLVPMPLNTRLVAAELQGMLAPIAPMLVVTDVPHTELARALGLPVLVLPDANAAAPLRDRLSPLWSERPRAADVAEDDIALIIGTGGTTGVPKGAMMTHRGAYLWAAAQSYNGGRMREDVELYFSPFFHVGMLTGWLATLFAGASVRVLGHFSVERALEAIDRGATFMTGTPTMYAMLRRHEDFRRIDRSRVRLIGVGAMAIVPGQIEELIADFPGARLRHSYGATEFGPVTVILHEDFMAGRHDGVGLPLPNCRVTIVDEALRPLPQGEVGEIVIGCPWQAAGYWGNPGETEATFTPLGVRLGDLGSLGPGGWLTMRGRRKEMVVSGGENVFPNEVETVLVKHPAVREVTVYGAKHPDWGERVEAVAVLQPGASLTHGELVDFARPLLAGYKLPKRLRILDNIPLTPSNKPDRLRLAREAAGDESAV